MRYQHFIWDFDGTLFNTYPRMVKCFDHALRQCGVVESEEEILRRIKVSVGSALKYFQEKHAIDPAFDFMAAYYAYERTLPADTMIPYPGMPELIRETHELGAHHHLYTHRDRAAFEALERYGILDCFEGRITSQDPFPKKPAPDALLSLIHRGLVNPASACMVGDRDIDVEAAHAAGIDGCLFDPEHFYEAYDTPYRVQSVPELLAWMAAG